MSDLRALVPVTDNDCDLVRGYITIKRPIWQQHLAAGLDELVTNLRAAGYTQYQDVMTGQAGLESHEVIVAARLKDTNAIVAKMRRFGEPLRVMLDVWGYRAVVVSEATLDDVALRCAELWETPLPDEMLLRHGALQFDWWRDYRLRSHAGLSPATTARYDEAIHLNRKAPFGIVEIQVITLDLYHRVHCDTESEDRHDRYVARRDELLRGDER